MWFHILSQIYCLYIYTLYIALFVNLTYFSWTFHMCRLKIQNLGKILCVGGICCRILFQFFLGHWFSYMTFFMSSILLVIFFFFKACIFYVQLGNVFLISLLLSINKYYFNAQCFLTFLDCFHLFESQSYRNRKAVERGRSSVYRLAPQMAIVCWARSRWSQEPRASSGSPISMKEYENFSNSPPLFQVH